MAQRGKTDYSQSKYKDMITQMSAVFGAPYETLEITTNTRCSVGCFHCPQDVLKRSYCGQEWMSLDNFKGALRTVPKTVLIDFSGFSEPFLNPKCVDMLEIATFGGYSVYLNTTLVGLHFEDIERLKKCNIKGVTLHLPDNIGSSRIPITPEYGRVLAEFLASQLICSVSIHNDLFVSNERAGACKDAPQRHVRGQFYCKKLVHPQFVMMPNCDLQLCCMDWGCSTTVGNLLVSGYEEIRDKGEVYQEVRRNRTVFEGDTLCRKCKMAYPMWKYQMIHAGLKVYNTLTGE